MSDYTGLPYSDADRRLLMPSLGLDAHCTAAVKLSERACFDHVCIFPITDLATMP